MQMTKTSNTGTMKRTKTRGYCGNGLSSIIASKDQSLRTNYRKPRVENTTNIASCRLCKEKDEYVV